MKKYKIVIPEMVPRNMASIVCELNKLKFLTKDKRNDLESNYYHKIPNDWLIDINKVITPADWYKRDWSQSACSKFELDGYALIGIFKEGHKNGRLERDLEFTSIIDMLKELTEKLPFNDFWTERITKEFGQIKPLLIED